MPFRFNESFLKKWKDLSEQRAEQGMFIDIKPTEEGVSVLSIGINPELALFFLGLSWGVSGYATSSEAEKVLDNAGKQLLTRS